MAISDERMEWLAYCRDNETNEPETQEWRDDLTPEEADLVDTWDEQYREFVYRALTKIKEAEARNKWLREQGHRAADQPEHDR